MKAGYHSQQDDERSQLLHPQVPLDLRIQIERAARRMAGYWRRRRIADVFLTMIKNGDPLKLSSTLQEYLAVQDDPRLFEIMGRLEEIYLAWLAAH